MNRAEAKREALWRIACLAEANMNEADWPFSEIDYPEADEVRIRNGLMEAIEELKRRGA